MALVGIFEFAGMVVGLYATCFTGDTLVATEDGSRRIDQIKVGDKVWAYNPDTGEKELKEVVSVFVKETDEILHLETTDGTIDTTTTHPFYVVGQGWTAAGDLKAGDEIYSLDGTTVIINGANLEKLDETIKVYNLEVADFHTYFVGNTGMLVHNRCGADDGVDMSGNPSKKPLNTGKWNKGSFDNAEDSLLKHYAKHGAEVGATSPEQYLRKAEEFARTAKKGSSKSSVSGAVEGVTRYRKNGKYIDIAPDGSIISFGKV